MKNFQKHGFLLFGMLTLLLMAFVALPADTFAAVPMLADAHHLLAPASHDFGFTAAAPAIAGIRNATSGANPGGTTRLYVIPWEDVESITPPVEGSVIVTEDIELKVGKQFHEWEFTQDTGKITWKGSGEIGSQAIEVEKTVYIPTMSPAIAAIIEASINRRFIIVFVDSKGQKQIGGDINRPMTLEPAYDSGAKFNEKNGTTLVFKCGSSHVPWFYTGAIPVAPVV